MAESQSLLERSLGTERGLSTTRYGQRSRMYSHAYTVGLVGLPALGGGGSRHYRLSLGAAVVVAPPRTPAGGAEDSLAGGAGHGGGHALSGAGAQAAHGLALQHRTPGPAGVQLHP